MKSKNVKSLSYANGPKPALCKDCPGVSGTLGWPAASSWTPWFLGGPPWRRRAPEGLRCWAAVQVGGDAEATAASPRRASVRHQGARLNQCVQVGCRSPVGDQRQR